MRKMPKSTINVKIEIYSEFYTHQVALDIIALFSIMDIIKIEKNCYWIAFN